MADSSTIDKELYDGLQQCRKKKPRFFCVVAKGAEVVKMIVQKKKINDGQAQKAKSENKGNLVVTGVVIGEGMDLSFEITGAEPSITPKRIKDYISDNTDLTLKPKWTVVTELRQVEEEAEGKESETQQKSPPVPPPVPPTAQKPPTAPPPPPTAQQPPVPPPPPPGAQKPPSPPPGQVPPAPPPPPQTKSESPPKAPPPAPPGDLLAELIAKMNKLSPAIQAAAAANPALKAELLKLVADFQADVKAKDAAGAQEALKSLAALLLKSKEKSEQSPPVPPPPGTKPVSSETAPVPPPPPNAKQESEQSETEGEAGKSAEELKADEFKQNWAAARKQLRMAIDKVEEQLTALSEALLKSNDPNMLWVAENGLTQILSGLRASATTIDKTGSKTPAKTAAFAKPAIAELEKQLGTERVKVCDQNKFGVKVSIKKTIEGALEELMKTLESAAE